MKNKKGFSLIELLVVIAIIAILAAYAIPNYRQYVIRSKRVEAQNKVLEMAGMFEKFYANTNAYPSGVGTNTGELNLGADFTEGHDYDFSGSSAGGGWTITATAKGAQATDDTSCGTITFNNLGQKAPVGCWGD